MKARSRRTKARNGADRVALEDLVCDFEDHSLRSGSAARIAGNSLDFRRTAGRLLCCSDCMAEREGFDRGYLSDVSRFQQDRSKSFETARLEPCSMCLSCALLSLQFTSVRQKMESKWNRNLA